MRTNWKKNITLFLTSQVMSMFGTMLVQYAILWHLVLETKSGSMMTLYIIVGVLPTFFTSLLGGIWADKYNKKHLINISDGSIGFISLIIAITLFAGFDSITLLLFAAMIRALGQGIQQPAVNSLIPAIVPEDKLLKINGINASMQSGISLISPIISAALMSFMPLATIFLIDVITAAIAVIILYFFVKIQHINRTEQTTVTTSYFKDLTDGLQYIKSQRYLYKIIILSAAFMFVMSPVAFLSPLQVTRNFGEDLWHLSAMEIAFAAGMMLGGVLVGIWNFRNRIYSMAIAAIIFGIMTVLLGMWTNFIPYLICMGICGLIAPYYNAASMTLMQEKVNPEYMGRVLSIFTMIGSVAMPLGMLLFGPFGDIISLNYIFIGTGIAMAVIGALFFASRTLKRAGIKVEI